MVTRELDLHDGGRLDLRGLKAQDLSGLNPDALARMAAQMLQHIGDQGKQRDERNKLIAEQAKLLHFTKPKRLVVDELGDLPFDDQPRNCSSSSSAAATSAARCG